ncbi:helicase domain protein [Candidatus Vecturithrix granuli]|uniref:Helicase domain protein n=1 Tax=Vecturithrix granuli TaxID=1499967 RepID=A0A0S6W659_VECG1|nr:helicase domain protein [Candidatus Vecturithrix granuli]
MAEKFLQGTIITGPNWPEPVEIKLIEETGDYVHIVGATKHSRQHIDQLLSKAEFAQLQPDRVHTNFSAEAWKVFLALETLRYRFASMYDPLIAMNASKVDPLPHQIEAVYGCILKKPRIRFLIADDPGAGKTIMAGLLIKELKIRQLVKRILIVAPGHLRDQWRRELKERFEEIFIPVGRQYLDALFGQNVWMRENQVVTSLDFAKREDILPSIAAAHFDLIIVDEAHKMSAYRYGEKIDKTSRYKLGETLSNTCEHLLFLTATPHKGDPENFRLFLDLIEPGFFATNELVAESVKSKDNPLFIRRIKEDLQDFEGKPLFLPRHVHTVGFHWKTTSPHEVELYNALSHYVETQYNKALAKDKRRNIAFALVILQRRLASSTYALLKSLERRKKRLEEYLQGAAGNQKFSENAFDFESVEDMSEEERWREEEIWETLSVAENRAELEKEIRILAKLIEQAAAIIQQEEEIKLKEFKRALQELSAKYQDPQDKKILVFTESRDTLDYLENKIRAWGYRTNTIHGGMKLEERIKAEGIFKHETDVLIATEAAGEGINLQFCHLMLNYDIPWNPNRLEQRMGRIHRYGQQKEVFVFNLVALDTREGMVLHTLFEKLDEIRNAMGSDKVFDVLDEVLYQQNLAQLMLEAAAHARSMEDILQELDIKVDEEYIQRIKENLGESLATRYIDYTRIKAMAQIAREHRLIPEYTESFFKKALLKAGGKFRKRKDGFLAIESIPFEIRALAEDDTFKKAYGDLLRRYPKATFDKEIAFKHQDAEFLCFGHPLFEAMMLYIEQTCSDALLTGATFLDPDGLLDGYIVFYEGEIRDGIGSAAGKRLFSFYVQGQQVKPFPAAGIWDLAEASHLLPTPCPSQEGNKSEFPSWEGQGVGIEQITSISNTQAINALENYKQELLQERQRQAAIKEKYGVQSLEYLDWKLDGELIALLGRQEQGENVDLVIRNKQERKASYGKALNELKAQIGKEKSLTMSMPRFKGIIRVVPATLVEPDMRSDPEVERIGMEISMAYEQQQQRIPEDVADQNLGFDIRSRDPKTKDIRYIEVKARSTRAAVALTQNEWFKAKQFKDAYYLYVVLNTAAEPKLYIIQNPAENVNAEEKIEVVRYIIPLTQIQEKGKLNN